MGEKAISAHVLGVAFRGLREDVREDQGRKPVTLRLIDDLQKLELLWIIGPAARAPFSAKIEQTKRIAKVTIMIHR